MVFGTSAAVTYNPETPLSVEVFSREGKYLGDKKTLMVQIHEITSIAVQAP